MRLYKLSKAHAGVNDKRGVSISNNRALAGGFVDIYMALIILYLWIIKKR